MRTRSDHAATGDAQPGALSPTLAPSPLPGHRYRRLSLAPTPTAPTEARSLLADALDQWQVPSLREPAALVVTELVSNAVRHARTDIEVHLARHDGGLCIAVRDGNPAPPRPRRAGADGGRGLHLVNLLADRWGWLPGGREKLVWAFLTALAPKRRTAGLA